MNSMRKTVKNPPQQWLVMDDLTGDVVRTCSTLEEAERIADGQTVGSKRSWRYWIHEATYEGMDREYIRPHGTRQLW